MIQLPKTKRDPKETEGLCKCRPICKSRRREWKGEVHNTSAELLLDREPKPECFRRYPKKVFPNGPCPLFARSKRVTVKIKNAERKVNVVRICQAPLDVEVDTPYLKYAELAKTLGAWQQVRSPCAFCSCMGCICGGQYCPLDAERAMRRRDDMRAYDSRVKHCTDMQIMYDL